LKFWSLIETLLGFCCRHAPLPPPDPLRNFHTPPVQPAAVPLKPISITQPDGPSWLLDGNAVSWHNWRFRIGFTPREGLTLHNLALYDADQCRIRPVAHRLSFAEMVVPYGDPAAPHYRKNAFDAGEDGMGKNAHSLKLGCDCVGHIQYFDAHFTSFRGKVCSIANAVCMHEEDFGMGWKHVDWHNGVSSQRRSRRLAVSFVCTVANYEYGFFYYLYLDGRVEFEVKLTGVLSTMATVIGTKTPYGTTLAPGLAAPIHQHFFNCRIHMAADTQPGCATANNVLQVDTTTRPKGEDNPHHNAFAAQCTPLETELQARSDCNSASSRHWLIASSHRKNRTGEPTAWQLVPHGNVHPFAHPEAMFLRRAQFLKHQLWVTRYDPEHRYPGGEFPNQVTAIPHPY
jgi:primary-amine oxidase